MDIRTYLQPTDHEMIPARNASLAAMKGSASGSNVYYYPTWKHSPLKKKWTRLLQCPIFAVRLWGTTSPYRWPIGNLPSTCMVCTPPHCTKTFTPRGDQLVIWTQYSGLPKSLLPASPLHDIGYADLVSTVASQLTAAWLPFEHPIESLGRSDIGIIAITDREDSVDTVGAWVSVDRLSSCLLALQALSCVTSALR
jgi:hypothetical protein